MQGPVDQYGLALFLSGKVSWVGTLITVSAATRYGFDIQVYSTIQVGFTYGARPITCGIKTKHEREYLTNLLNEQYSSRH